VCEDGGPEEAQRSAPRSAEGTAVDPIALEPVDEVVVTVLMDNSYDGLMADLGPGRRARLDRLPTVPAPQFEEGRTYPGLLAEHGFSALVTVRRGATGFHLTGAAFEPTVTAFADLAPAVLVPAHCTGWKAQHRFAAALPDAFVPDAVGTSHTVAAAPDRSPEAR
jgi:metal-dependent hydrolase (beta-lactamase superfamily II)